MISVCEKSRISVGGKLFEVFYKIINFKFMKEITSLFSNKLSISNLQIMLKFYGTTTDAIDP